VTVPAGTTAGTTTTSSTSSSKISGNGQNSIWEFKTTTTAHDLQQPRYHGCLHCRFGAPGHLLVDQYQLQFDVSTGVYIINGGELVVNAQYEVTGSGVMFVLKNGAGIRINGGADVNLTAIQASDLIARGISSSQANLLAGMLVFEDRNSSGAQHNRINGNASTILNGIIYLPVSPIDFMGTAGVTSQCLMIAASTINITGDANMSTFCPAGQELDDTVLSTQDRVKLVA
jgi:hypothetical protein